MLRTPGVGVVKTGIGNERGPGRHNLLFLARSRQSVLAAAVVTPAAAAKGLIHWHHAPNGNARCLCCGYCVVDHTIIAAVGFRSAGIGIEPIQVDMGNTQIEGVHVRRRRPNASPKTTSTRTSK